LSRRCLQTAGKAGRDCSEITALHNPKKGACFFFLRARSCASSRARTPSAVIVVSRSRVPMVRAMKFARIPRAGGRASRSGGNAPPRGTGGRLAGHRMKTGRADSGASKRRITSPRMALALGSSRLRPPSMRTCCGTAGAGLRRPSATGAARIPGRRLLARTHAGAFLRRGALASDARITEATSSLRRTRANDGALVAESAADRGRRVYLVTAVRDGGCLRRNSATGWKTPGHPWSASWPPSTNRGVIAWPNGGATVSSCARTGQGAWAEPGRPARSSR